MSTDNRQQTLCTVPEPVEGNFFAFSASLREDFRNEIVSELFCIAVKQKYFLNIY